MLPSTFIVLVDTEVTFELSISCKFSNVFFNLENIKDSSTSEFPYTLQKRLITYSKNFTSLAGYITVTSLCLQRETWRGAE
jgi:hypothetical protein